MKKEKSGFSSRIGFVMAAAGSAVGLGNLWRFPYLAAKYGGGTFLFIYLILVVTFGFCLMLTEITIGRKTGSTAVNAYKQLNKKYSFIGYLVCAVPAIILPYYCVIGGWVLKYLTVFTSGKGLEAADDSYFSGFITTTTEPVVWFIVFIVLTALVVMMGVEKGVEKVSKVLMPILVLLSLGIVAYCMTLPGANEGVIYYIKPDFSRFSVNAVLAALGQLFYSMSIAMGILITYGSYMNKKDDLEKSVRQIELFDTAIAFISGLIIVPAVFIFSGGDQVALSQGPGLMFATLPKVFASFKLGGILGTVFFVLVLFAALTSAISLMETLVSIVVEKMHWKRKKASLMVLLFVFIMGVPSSLGNGAWSSIKPLGLDILSFFDFISNSVLMPIVAFLTCIFVGYVVKPKTISDEVKSSGKFKSEAIYNVIIKYIAPIFLLLILISSILNAFGVITL